MIDGCMCVRGEGWACACLWGHRPLLCRIACLSSHCGPFLEKFQAIFEASWLTCARVSASRKHRGLAQSTKQRGFSVRRAECSSDRDEDVARTLPFGTGGDCVFAFRPGAFLGNQ